MTNGKILKINPLSIVLFTDVSLNLIKKAFGPFCVNSWSLITNRFLTTKIFTYYMGQFEKNWIEWEVSKKGTE